MGKGEGMKIIINAEPADLLAVTQLILNSRHMFEAREPRLGWGWNMTIPGGKSFFISEIKGGFSAKPSKPFVSRAKAAS
jgi:hypothetical protein